ncbi:MAG: aminopeptidase N C-terminal domain-containing protein, partial [Pseudomonadota bacterium]
LPDPRSLLDMEKAASRVLHAVSMRQRIAIFADAQATIVADEDLETAYRAEILRLPSEADIARELQRNVDPDAIHEARDTMMQQLGKLNGRVLKGLYDTLATDEAYAPTPEQVGRRSLRNIALVYLTARGGAADRKRVKAHFETASNMTDQALALTILAHGTGKARTEALDAFYEQWQDDQLVLQTWFAVQATSAASGTPARMRTLMKHPAYNATTPNTIRAVVGQFAMGNPVQFNRADGEGYRFVADQVLAIDKVNPQVAARICGSFRSWRALEAGRRKLAKAAIKSLAQSDGLSRDVYEIATKILD